MTAYEHLLSIPVSPYWDKYEREDHEYRLYNARVDAIIGLHREGWLPIDWVNIVRSPAPPQPVRNGWREHQAAQALAAFKPTLGEQVFGSQKRRSRLEQEVAMARAADEQEFQAAYAAYSADLQRWHWFQQLAQSVLSGDPAACQMALDHLGPFQVFQQMGSSLNVVITRSWCVEAWLVGNTSTDVVPFTHIDITAKGNLSRRDMSDKRYWELYQDHVCSAALRVAREIFSILPIPIALVHVGYPFTSSRTGHPEFKPVLSVAIDKPTFESLNLHVIDPSDSMDNFEHRMEQKRGSPMMAIEPLTPNDLGIAED